MKKLIVFIVLSVSLAAGCVPDTPSTSETSQGIVLPATCSYTPHLGEEPETGGFCGFGLQPITWRGLTFCSSADCNAPDDPCYHGEGRCVLIDLQPFVYNTWCLPFADHGDLYGCPEGFEIDGPTDYCLVPEP